MNSIMSDLISYIHIHTLLNRTSSSQNIEHTKIQTPNKQWPHHSTAQHAIEYHCTSTDYCWTSGKSTVRCLHVRILYTSQTHRTSVSSDTQQLAHESCTTQPWLIHACARACVTLSGWWGSREIAAIPSWPSVWAATVACLGFPLSAVPGVSARMYRSPFSLLPWPKVSHYILTRHTQSLYKHL